MQFYTPLSGEPAEGGFDELVDLEILCGNSLKFETHCVNLRKSEVLLMKRSICENNLEIK